MQKAVNIMNKVAMILSIISIILHALAAITIVAIPGLIISILSVKQLKNGKPTIVMGVLNVFFTYGANVVLGLPVVPVCMIVAAILNKKLNAQASEEYYDEVEELVEE